jgi:hypothetical protein
MGGRMRSDFDRFHPVLLWRVQLGITCHRTRAVN